MKVIEKVKNKGEENHLNENIKEESEDESDEIDDQELDFDENKPIINYLPVGPMVI